MARLSPLNIAGGAYSDDARPWSAQDTVNYLPVPAERAGTRSPSLLRSAPGFDLFTEISPYPIRGLHNVEGELLAVSGMNLVRVRPDGTFRDIGAIPGVGRVTMAHNQIKHGHEVVIANGQSGYLYRTTDGTFQQITDPGFPGFKAVDFVDGYIAGIEPAGRFWLHSDLLDAGSYNTMDRYDAEASPDKMVAIVVSSREVMILSSRSTQFFRNVGGATGTFANSSGTEIEVGCASTHAVARLDNTVYWLGHDGVVYRLAGHQPQRVSTGPIEQAISRSNMANAFAFTFEDRGHKVFYLTFPDGHTWGYDVWSGEWHRRQSQGFERWRLSSLVKWDGRWIGGDFANGRLYQLDWEVQHEAGAEMEKRRITPALHDNQNPVTVSALEIVVDTGLPQGEIELPQPAPPGYTVSVSGFFEDAIVGTPYEGGPMVASGGYEPYRWSMSALPAGLSLDPDGYVRGTPVATGSITGDVTATDRYGVSATVTRTLKVAYASGLGVTTALPTGKVVVRSGDTETFPVLMEIVDPGRSFVLVRFSGDGSEMAVYSNSGAANEGLKLELYRRADTGGYVPVPGALEWTDADQQMLDMSFTADGAYLAAGGAAPYLRVFRRGEDGTYSRVADLDTGGVNGQVARWSPSGEYLVGSNAFGRTLLFRRNGDSFGPDLLAPYSNTGTSYSAAWSRDSNLLILPEGYGSSRLQAFRVEDGNVTRLAQGPIRTQAQQWVRLSPDGQYVYVVSRSAQSDGSTLEVFQFTGTAFVKLDGPAVQPPGGTQGPNGMDSSFDGRILAVATGGHGLFLYQCDGPTLTPLAGHGINQARSVAFMRSSDHWS